ncbi:MAG: CDP-alcohol phosphatidyltransferase family protein [Pseudomonadales bacterium]|nr:CDP-alcohol phosphatidyltransferase family protein [Pseudomonadales bacterium]
MASSLRHLPNLISALRVVLVVPAAYYLWMGQYNHALVVMMIAGVSDAIDGWLARTFEWTSQLGEIIDPIADKLLIGTLFIVLSIKGHIPLWLVSVVVGRDLIILAGAIAYRLTFGKEVFPPTMISKANTAVQLIVLFALLLSLCGIPNVSEWAIKIVNPAGVFLVLMLGLASGLDYINTWSRKSWESARERKAQDKSIL